MTEETIFARAIEINNSEERRLFLDDACENAVLRNRVEDLIAAHGQPDSVLDGSVNAGETSGYEPATARWTIGSKIGPYKLLEEIGEGGMGIVYVAERLKPIRQRVAIKVIKPGMDSREVIARFEAERQALALMDHPNVAKVLDAGTSECGQPYFVMEHIKGIPITNYCDEKNLSTEDRLKLFRQVCHGVQHSHQKGIIHRDLKPNNILVADYDDEPVPKIIDFGVAKALYQPLTDKTLYTRRLHIVGTLQYMSPEQAKMNQSDIDTRSDIYALGVLLYELLTGLPPFERKTLEEAGLEGMCKIIREQEPARPSDKLKTLDAKVATDIAEHRSTQCDSLGKLLRSDLDWIVMKALEKDRNRRYETANGLSGDVQRYLRSEATTASPPTFRYQSWKWYSRHKAAVWVAGSFAMLLVCATFVASLGWISAAGARDDAKQSLQLSERRLDAIGKYMTLIGTTDVASLSPKELEQLFSKFTDELNRPATLYDLHDAKGTRSRKEGRFSEAERSLAKAEIVGEATDDIPPIKIVWTQLNRARIRAAFKDYEQAVAFYRKAVQVRGIPAVASLWAQQELAYYLSKLGKTEESQMLYGQVADDLQRHIADGDMLWTRNATLGVFVITALRGNREMDLEEEAKRLQDRLANPSDRSEEFYNSYTYGELQEKMGNDQIAVEFYDKAVHLRQFNGESFHEAFPVDWIEVRLATLLEKSGESGSGIADKMRQWNAIREEVLLPDHPAIAYGNLRLAKWMQEHSLPDSVQYLKEAKAILKQHEFTPQWALTEIDSLIEKAGSEKPRP